MLHYFIYRTTNLINGKYYIGKHVTNNIDDGYLGSGLALKKALKKYGVANFRRDILVRCADIEELNLKESQIVTSDICNDPMSYNIALGGQGGQIVLVEGHPLYVTVCGKIAAKAQERSEQISDRVKQLHKEMRVGMYGKKHSEETKQKMSVSGKKVDRHWLTGRKLSDEAKQRISEARRLYWQRKREETGL